jgi:hypothetical protein
VGSQDPLCRWPEPGAGEIEDELERREEGLQRQVRDAYEERLLTLKDDLVAAAAARDQATALLVSLVQPLFSERQRSLDDAGVTERDPVGLTQVLAPKGVQIRRACRHSARGRVHVSMARDSGRSSGGSQSRQGRPRPRRRRGWPEDRSSRRTSRGTLR